MEIKKIALGVDIGGTNTVLGFVDESGKYLFGDSFFTDSEENIKGFIKKLGDKINSILNKNAEDYNFVGIGIAAPSANYFKGTIESPSNLKWGNINIVDMMHDLFEVPIILINDANAAAIGELNFGSAKEVKNFAVITLGTGLGSGIVVDGNPLLGENGLAGEFGHVIIEKNGRLCNCGRQGCLETYASVSGLKRTVYELLSYYNCKSVFKDITFDKLTGQLISEEAIKGEQIAVKAFDYTGEKLGRALSNLAAFFAPEIIILAGGLLKAGELILNPTRKYFEKYLLGIHKNKVKIIKSEFEDGMAAVLGAGSIVFDELNGKFYSSSNKDVKLV